MASLLEVVQKQLDKMHPIGSYYLTEDGNNPSVSLGFGTWVKIEGKFLLGSSSSYATANEGGEATHTLSNSEMPNHSHRLGISNDNSGNWAAAGITEIVWKSKGIAPQGIGGVTGGVSGTFGDRGVQYYMESTVLEHTGGGQPDNNMPPYRVVNIWRRTA